MGPYRIDFSPQTVSEDKVTIDVAFWSQVEGKFVARGRCTSVANEQTIDVFEGASNIPAPDSVFFDHVSEAASSYIAGLRRLPRFFWIHNFT